MDEKTSIQTLERKTGYIETDSGKVVRVYRSTYKRHGTFNLFLALQVATGQVQTASTQLQRLEQFLQFMDQVVAESGPSRNCTSSWRTAGRTKNATLGWLGTPMFISTSL